MSRSNTALARRCALLLAALLGFAAAATAAAQAARVGAPRHPSHHHATHRRHRRRRHHKVHRHRKHARRERAHLAREHRRHEKARPARTPKRPAPARPPAPAPVPAPAPGPASALGFDGDFNAGLRPWIANGGGAQCANYGTPSKSPRLRGNFVIDHNVAGMASAGRFDLPADSDTSNFPLEACDLVSGGSSIGLGTDGYYGLMIYVPQGWTIPNNFFGGVEIAEYHFQNVYGAPVSFQLHADHVTLALQTGSCNNHATTAPGCVYHSNADNPSGNPGTLPAEYAIPRGALRQGAWNEILMRVHWASDNSGQIQTWYRVKGAPAWTPSSNLTGIPTIQWDVSTGCCTAGYSDLAEAYTGALSAPMSLWLANEITGSSFNAIAQNMP